MKDQKQSFDKMVEWARDAHSSPEFKLSSETRERVLRSWRREAASEGGDSVLYFLRWAVAYSIAIMAISVLFNFDVLQSSETVKIDGSPQTVFQSRTPSEFYLP
jgi:hypothetical protein